MAIKEVLKALIPNSTKKAVLESILLAGLMFPAGLKSAEGAPEGVVCKDGVCYLPISKSTENVKMETLEQEISSGNVVIDFYTDWCGPCKVYSPNVEKVGEEYASKGIKVMKINAEKEAAIAKKFGVRAYPTTIFLKNGQVEGNFSGPDKDRLKRKIETIFLGKKFDFDLKFKNRASPGTDSQVDIVLSQYSKGILEEYDKLACELKDVRFNAVDIESEQAKDYGLASNGGIVFLSKGKILDKKEFMINEDLEEKIQDLFFNKKIKYSESFSEQKLSDIPGFPSFIIGKNGKINGLIFETVDNKYNLIENNKGNLNFKGPIYDSSKSRLYNTPAGIFLVEEGKVYSLDDHQNKKMIYDLKSNVEMDIISKKPQIAFANKEGDKISYVDGSKTRTLIEKFSDGRISKISYIPQENKIIFKSNLPQSKLCKLNNCIDGKQSIISEACYDFESADIDKDKKEETIYSTPEGVFLFKDGSSRKICNKIADYVKIEDIDNNGFKDVLCEGSQHLYWLKNQNGKNFELEYISPKAQHFKGAIDIGDIDGDGYKDIAYLNKILKYSPKK